MATSKKTKPVNNVAAADETMAKLEKAITRTGKKSKGKAAGTALTVAQAATVKSDRDVIKYTTQYEHDIAQPESFITWLTRIMGVFATRAWDAKGAGVDELIALERKARERAFGKCEQSRNAVNASQFKQCLRLAPKDGGLDCWARIRQVSGSYSVCKSLALFAWQFNFGMDTKSKKKKAHNRWPTVDELRAARLRDAKSRESDAKKNAAANKANREALKKGKGRLKSDTPAFDLAARLLDAARKINHNHKALGARALASMMTACQTIFDVAKREAKKAEAAKPKATAAEKPDASPSVVELAEFRKWKATQKGKAA